MAGSLLLGDPPVAPLARRGSLQALDVRLHAAQATTGFRELQHLVARQGFAPRLKVFLQFGLGILVRDLRVLRIERSREPPRHRGERGRNTGIKTDGRDECLQGIGEYGVAITPAGSSLAAAEPQFRAHAEFSGEPREGFLPHEARAQTAQLALAQSGVSAEEFVCDAEIQQRITEELETFVVGLAETGVCEGEDEEFPPRKAVTDARLYAPV